MNNWRHACRHILFCASALYLTSFVRHACADGTVAFGVLSGATLGGTTEQLEPIAGIELSAPLSHSLRAEMAVLRFTDHPEEERLGITVTGASEITPIQLSCRYVRRLTASVEASALAGIGWYLSRNIEVETSGIIPGGPVSTAGDVIVDRNDAAGWHAGLGLEWTPLARVAAGLEYRFASTFNRAVIHGLKPNSPEGIDAIEAFEKDFRDNNEIGALLLTLRCRF
ncbi:MAG: hypothetical protein FJ224_09195 [Lentisphaerae bacterium]|nr:hypothetical protein [Lentisphaerota bacterium]